MLVSQCDGLSSIKGALSGLGQFLATESPLKMMKKIFLFHLKSSFCSQAIQFVVLVMHR